MDNKTKRTMKHTVIGNRIYVNNELIGIISNETGIVAYRKLRFWHRIINFIRRVSWKKSNSQ